MDNFYSHPLVIAAAERLAERLAKKDPKIEVAALAAFRIWRNLTQKSTSISFCDYLDASIGLDFGSIEKNALKKSNIIDLSNLQLVLPKSPVVEGLPLAVLHESADEMTVAYGMPLLDKEVFRFFPAYTNFVYCPQSSFREFVNGKETRKFSEEVVAEKSLADGFPVLALRSIPQNTAPSNNGIIDGVFFLAPVLDGLAFGCKTLPDGVERWKLGDSFKNLYRLHFFKLASIGEADGQKTLPCSEGIWNKIDADSKVWIEKSLDGTLVPQEKERIVKAAREYEKQGHGDAGQVLRSLRYNCDGYHELAKLIEFAGNREASDIHLHAQMSNEYITSVSIKLRMGGKLSQFIAYEVDIAKLKNEITLLHQTYENGSGKIETKNYNSRFECRSTKGGVGVVLRILPKRRKLSLLDMGFSASDALALKKSMDSDSGLIVFSGPTGSGKSTSACTAFNEVDLGKFSLVTIEQPVEKKIHDAVQREVPPTLSFSEFVSDALRMDPDYIFIGETRDSSTLSSALQAAVTGHLVTTTMHGHSIKAVLNKLRQLVDKDSCCSLTDSLKTIVFQKLAPKPCSFCRHAKKIPDKFRKFLPEELREDERIFVFESSGCEKCNGTGTFGRVLVSVVIPVTNSVKDYLAGYCSWGELNDAYKIEHGFYLFDALMKGAVMKAVAGNCSLDFLEENLLSTTS